MQWRGSPTAGARRRVDFVPNFFSLPPPQCIFAAIGFGFGTGKLMACLPCEEQGEQDTRRAGRPPIFAGGGTLLRRQYSLVPAAARGRVPPPRLRLTRTWAVCYGHGCVIAAQTRPTLWPAGD